MSNSGVTWQRNIDVLHRITGLGFAVFSQAGQKLAENPVEAPICQLLRRCQRGKQLCAGCWPSVIANSKQNPVNDMGVSRECPGQLENFMARIETGGHLYGYVVGAEMRASGRDPDRRRFENVAEETGISVESLIDAYQQTPAISARQSNERKQRFDHGVSMLAKMASDSLLTKALDAIRHLGDEKRPESSWQSVTQWENTLWKCAAEWAVSLVPATSISIFAVSPACDTATCVWPKGINGTNVKPPTIKDLAAMVENEDLDHMYGDDDKLLVPIWGYCGPVAVFVLTAAHGVNYENVDLTALYSLGDIVGGVLSQIRANQSRVELARLEKRLKKSDSPHQRLTMIVEQCSELLDCEAGELALEDNPWNGYPCLRVESRVGQGPTNMPFTVRADIGVSGRVRKTRKVAVVPDTKTDCDFQEAVVYGNKDGLYEQEYWRKYSEHLQEIGAAITLPLLDGERVIGVIYLHRSKAGDFDMTKVDIIKDIADRAALVASYVLGMHDDRLGLDGNVERELQDSTAFANSLVRRRDGYPPKSASGDKGEAPGEARDQISGDLANFVLAKLKLRGVYRTAVRLVGPNGDSLGTAGRAGEWEPGELQDSIGRKDGSAATYAFFDLGKSYIVRDTAETNIHFKHIGHHAGSHASIMIQTGNQKLGILSVDWKEPGGPNDILIRQLEQIASFYAVRMGLYVVDKYTDKIDSDMRSAVTKSGKFDYQELLRQTAEVIGAQQGAIFIRRRDTGLYHLAAHLKCPRWSGDDNYYAWGQGCTGWVLKNNLPLRIACLDDPAQLRDSGCNVLEHADHIPDNCDKKKDLSFLAVPISVGREVIGVLRLTSPAARQFSCYDEQIAYTVASRLAGWLYRKMEAKSRNAIRKVAKKFVSVSEPSQLAKAVFGALRLTIGKCACHMRIRDKSPKDKTDILRFVAASKKRWQKVPKERRAGQGVAGLAWQERKAIIYQNVHEEPKIKQAILEDLGVKNLPNNVGCGACFPFIYDSKVIGTLHIHKDNVHALSPSEIESIKTITDLASRVLPAIADREKALLAQNIDEALDSFTVDLLEADINPDILKAFEADLLEKITLRLKEYLGGELAWVRVPDETGSMYASLEMTDEGTMQVPDLPTSVADDVLEKNDFIVIPTPEEVGPLQEYLTKQQAEFRNVVAGRQGCIINEVNDGQSIALFTVLLPRGASISYTRVEDAVEALKRVARQISIARRFEQKLRDDVIFMPFAFLGTMKSVLQHDLSKPVNGMKQAIDRLDRRRKLSLENHLDRLRSRHETIKNIITEFLELVETATCVPESVKVDALMESVAQDFGKSAPIELVKATSIVVPGRTQYLHQALKLLVQNAIEAIEKTPNGTVRITYESTRPRRGERRYCLIKIIDNGPGIPSAVYPHIWTPLCTTKSGVRGLGIPTAYCIIREHQGTLAIKSPDNNVGTVVTVSLPIK